MDTERTQEELIEEALDLLPRFRRSMFRHIGKHGHAGRGGPPWARGKGRRGLHHRGKRRRGNGSPAQMRIGMYLYRQGPAKVGDIAQWLGVSAPTASEQIDGLVEAGLAERTVNPDDRREVRVELTPKGLELADYYCNLQRSRVAAVFARFTPAEQPIVVRTLEVFAEVFEQDPSTFDDAPQEVQL